jgi:hypothetical protein
VRGELGTKDKEINNYHIDLLNKHEEIKEKKKTISELENLIVSAAKNDESVSKVEELITPPPKELKQLIGKWRKSSKPTRDWTKANQLLEELGNLLK